MKYGKDANKISKEIFTKKAEDLFEKLNLDITKNNMKIYIKYKSLGYKDYEIKINFFNIDYECLY